MAEKFRYLVDVDSLLYQSGCKGMPQIVKTEALYSCIFHCPDENTLEFPCVYPVACTVEEHVIAFDMSYSTFLLKQIEDSVVDRDRPCVLSLLPRCDNRLSEEVDVLPLQIEYFFLAHSGIQCEDNDVSQLSVEPVAGSL